MDTIDYGVEDEAAEDRQQITAICYELREAV
jgi:hypothetical protein